MIFSLDKRPKPDQQNKESTPLYWLVMYKEYLDGLVDELRCLLNDYRYQNAHDQHMIKEILGE